MVDGDRRHRIMLAHARAAVHDQLRIARRFYADPRLRGPLVVIWVASFGGALHAPVTTFYYLKLGATAADIGPS